MNKFAYFFCADSNMGKYSLKAREFISEKVDVAQYAVRDVETVTCGLESRISKSDLPEFVFIDPELMTQEVSDLYKKITDLEEKYSVSIKTCSSLN